MDRRHQQQVGELAGGDDAAVIQVKQRCCVLGGCLDGL